MKGEEGIRNRRAISYCQMVKQGHPCSNIGEVEGKKDI